MAKQGNKSDICFDVEGASGVFVRRVEPLATLQGSVHEYHQPFEPVGISDWEALLLEGLTPKTAHADELANPTMRELGQDPSD